ncbi:glycine cleavage system aminomethyltransferase GcvT [Haliscomenobacter hydrossis]|uniref:Aminomethyltransferase n=1 Tax=Haliscomenobacter hydrossis (strain ATCC 27775 / DSM 1100 / LMG 10767 / O) TaxID=760192 RepID=F4KYS7_HALH1|nr:glycine cleavage system aminomethyltransferase GcvT [Haliscomenobacter hydrossis]AEE51469.1 Aminomethyltransferase [Haliscomenobacter hydrossis DSM 1100]
MKNTPLTEKHIALGAKMAPFAGYNMPISYTGIQEEHHTVRDKVGVFDVSHMGEFIVRGKQALELIQQITTNDASKLGIGQAQYSAMPNEQGGIIDDLLVYRLPEDNCADGERAYMMVVNASNIEKDWNWVNAHLEPNAEFIRGFDTKVINISDQTSLIAVQGPKALQTLQPLTGIDLSRIKYYNFAKGKFAGFDNVLISATGYTGAGGFEIYVDNKQAAAIWDAVFEAGKTLGIAPIGLGARDTLRLEMGFCLYGNDIDDTTSPMEAGLGWITKLSKPSFIGKSIFEAQKAAGLSRKLVGFMLEDRRIPRHDYAILDAQGQNIGKVTSGSQSPTLGKPIGMGYVQTAYSSPGSEIFISIGGKSLPATVVKLPFLQQS